MARLNKNLPYRTFVEDFDATRLRDLRDQHDPLIPLSVLTEKELDLMQYAPSLLHKLNGVHGLDLPTSYEDGQRQFGVDLTAQFAILEGAVVRGYYGEPGHLESRVHAFRRLVNMSREFSGERIVYSWYPVFPTEEEIEVRQKEIDVERRGNVVPMPNQFFHDYDRWWSLRLRRFSPEEKLRLMYQMKIAYSQFLRSQKILDEHREPVRVNARRERLGLTDQLKDVFGRDISVVLYGSSTFGDGESKDYDTIVVTDRLPEEYYRRLVGQRFEWNGKPIDIVLVRRREWENFVVKNAYAMGVVKNGVVLEGDVEFPSLDRHEAVWRTMSRAGARIRMLHGVALNWAGVSPEEVVHREGLLVALSKVPRYLLAALLELKDLEAGRPHELYSNKTLDGMLSGMGVERVQFNQDPVHVRESLFRVMEDTARVVDAQYTPTWVQEYRGAVDILNNPPDSFLQELEQQAEVERSWREEFRRMEEGKVSKTSKTSESELPF